MAKYINPYTDFGFKKLFGEEGNKDLLIDFLNQLLPDVSLKDQDGEVFFDKLHFKFLQMPLFKLKENELKSKFDKWCYFLKNLESFDHIPNILNEPIFQKAFDTAELSGLTAEQRAIYEENLIQYWGMKSAIDTAVEEAVEAAVEDNRIEIAKRMIFAGSDNQFINQMTDLTVQQIEKLRTELKK
ncbi:MAG: hypothetical protein EAZ97_01340 [Bacteroidetes bacterium]|nr:MAG: hypothetical protein EAZ97_01340 [Bacteroidota bacterium]